MIDENRRMIEWMAIEANLAPEDLRGMMPKEEQYRAEARAVPLIYQKGAENYSTVLALSEKRIRRGTPMDLSLQGGRDSLGQIMRISVGT